jgi:hypothetical protein
MELGQMKICVLGSVFLMALMSVAIADPVVFLVSGHNLDYAKAACDHVIETEKISLNGASQNEVNQIETAVTQCKLEPDPRVLGRQLEGELLSALAASSRCSGVSVYRELDIHFDGDKFYKNYAEDQKIRDQTRLYWDLYIDFYPGKITFGWTLYPNSHGGNMQDVSGEGTSGEVADQVCTVVSGQGATIH